MARYKVKGKDCQLKVKVKLSFKEEIDERQLDFFSSKYIRGLLKVQAKKKNCIEFYGPIGISLFDRLKKPISKYDFFFIMEQVVDITQKANLNSLILRNVVWDIHYVFINETTKELQFIYLPLTNDKKEADVLFREQSASGQRKKQTTLLLVSAHSSGLHTDFHQLNQIASG